MSRVVSSFCVWIYDPHDWRSKERRKEKNVRAGRKKGALNVLANWIDHEKVVLSLSLTWMSGQHETHGDKPEDYAVQFNLKSRFVIFVFQALLVPSCLFTFRPFNPTWLLLSPWCLDWVSCGLASPPLVLYLDLSLGLSWEWPSSLLETCTLPLDVVQ